MSRPCVKYLSHHGRRMMLSSAQWEEIMTPKQLICDQHGQRWEADNEINCFMSRLPWWCLDRDLQRNCVLYQVDTNGALRLIQLIYICYIRTLSDKIVIVYKTDERHARLEHHFLPLAFVSKVGLMSVVPVNRTFELSDVEFFQTPLKNPSSS